MRLSDEEENPNGAFEVYCFSSSSTHRFIKCTDLWRIKRVCVKHKCRSQKGQEYPDATWQESVKCRHLEKNNGLQL
jgi:hypothetical protein